MSSREKNSLGRTCRRFRYRPELQAAKRSSGSRSRSAPPSAASLLDWLQCLRAQYRARPHEMADRAWRQAWKTPKKNLAVPQTREYRGENWPGLGRNRGIPFAMPYRSLQVSRLAVGGRRKIRRYRLVVVSSIYPLLTSVLPSKTRERARPTPVSPYRALRPRTKGSAPGMPAPVRHFLPPAQSR